MIIIFIIIIIEKQYIYPILAIILIEATTYGESVSSIPVFESGETIGPMENGTTYIVRPLMQPYNNAKKTINIDWINGQQDPVLYL